MAKIKLHPIVCESETGKVSYFTSSPLPDLEPQEDVWLDFMTDIQNQLNSEAITLSEFIEKMKAKYILLRNE